MIPKHWIGRDGTMPAAADPLADDAARFARQYFHPQGGQRTLSLYRDQAWFICGGRNSIRRDFQSYFADGQVAVDRGVVISVWWVQRALGHKMKHMVSVGAHRVQSSKTAYHRFYTSPIPIAEIQHAADRLFRWHLSRGVVR